MSTVRKLQPHPRPVSAAIVELNKQIPEGPGDVELPARVWSGLVTAAAAELGAVACPPLQSSVDVFEFDRELELLRNFRDEVREILAAPKGRPDANVLVELRQTIGAFLDSQRGAMLKAGGPGPKYPTQELEALSAAEVTARVFEPLPPPKKKRKSKAEAQREAIERAGGFHCDDCAAFCKLERPGTWDGRKQCQACRKLFDDAATATPPKQEEVPF